MDDDGSCADGSFDARYGYDLDGNRLWARLHDGQTETVVVQIEGLADWTRGSNDAQIHVVAFGRRVATKYLESAVVLAAPTYVPGTKVPLEPDRLLLAVALAGGLWLLVIGVRDGVPARIAERPAAATVVVLTSAMLVAPPQAWAGGGGGGGGGPQVYRRWLFHDHLGTNVLVTNVNGAVIRRRLFEPFGKLLIEQSSTEPHDRLFTGQRYEENTGLYDFQQRWYDAETGRFTGVDPVVQSPADPQTINAYGYVRNNPLTNVDPMGTQSIGVGFNLTHAIADAIAGRGAARGVGPMRAVAAQNWVYSNAPPPAASGLSLNLNAGWIQVASNGWTAIPALGSGGSSEGSFSATAALSLGFRVFVFDYQDPLGGSYALEALSVVGPGKLIKGLKVGNRILKRAKVTARLVDQNKLHHIFGKTGHGLDDLLEAAGSREAAFAAIDGAAQDALARGQLTFDASGVFENVVKVGGVDTTVKGKVVDGIARIGSAWR